jgi:hypothetical protein
MTGLTKAAILIRSLLFWWLLETGANLIIFGGKELSRFVWEWKGLNNTVFIEGT